MANCWLAVDSDGSEAIFDAKPIRNKEFFIDLDLKELAKVWVLEDIYDYNDVAVPKGSIEKLIGYKLTWEDEPVELKEEA